MSYGNVGALWLEMSNIYGWLNPWNFYEFWPGGRLNIKMPSRQYKDSHVKDKTVSSTIFSLTWESPYLGKTVFILRWGPGGRLNKKDGLTRYGDSHVKDKTAVRTSYL